MTKLQNASNNLLEMCQAAIDGKKLQCSSNSKDWIDRLPHYLFVSNSLAMYWRVKPDAFEKEFEKWDESRPHSYSVETVAKYFWNAAMAHKENEND